MKDDAYQDHIDAVHRILKQLKHDDLEESDAEELYTNALEHISAARELLDVGNGEIEIVD